MHLRSSNVFLRGGKGGGDWGTEGECSFSHKNVHKS